MKQSLRFFLVKLIPPAFLLLLALFLSTGYVRNNLITGSKAHMYLDAALWFFLFYFILRLLDLIWVSSFSRRKLPFPVPKVLHSIILFILYLAVLFGILRGILNINITPFLATSALLTMILGLAFQGVLSNIISGLSLHFTKSFAKGDWIGIKSDEGIVLDTNWRETRILDRFSNIVVIPNNTMASEKIINFSKPSKRSAITIPVKTGFSAPPTLVFSALREAAKDSPDVLDKPVPEIHLLSYEDWGVAYTLKFWINDFSRKFIIMAEVGSNVWYKFKRHNIEIPVPLNEKLYEMMGALKLGKMAEDEKAQQERIFRSLMSSNFLRYQEGPKKGELLVSDADIREFAKSVICQRYGPGEVVFRQGETGDSCYIVTSGVIKGEIIYEEKGKKYVSDFRVQPPMIFGEMSLFTGMPRTATGIIEVDAELLEIKRADFAKLLERNPAIADVIADIVSLRNQKNQDFLKKIKELSEQDIKESISKHSILDRLKSFISGWQDHS